MNSNGKACKETVHEVMKVYGARVKCMDGSIIKDYVAACMEVKELRFFWWLVYGLHPNP
jgi:hypothetical protein